MADGYRAVCVKQKHRHGLSDYIRASDDNAFFAANVNTRTFKKHHNTRGCARQKIVITYHNFSYVVGMEGINILFGFYLQENFGLIEMLGKRQLHEYSVYFFIVVELFHKFDKLLLCCFLGKLIALGVKSDLLASSFFVANVHLRCGVVSNNHNCESRSTTVFLLEGNNLCGYFFPYLLAYCLSVNYLCHFALLLRVLYFLCYFHQLPPPFS